jgi:hypothetical protein
MSKADDYRRRAEECKTSAARARDPKVKRALEEAARRWRLMAEQAERYGF